MKTDALYFGMTSNEAEVVFIIIIHSSACHADEGSIYFHVAYFGLSTHCKC